MNAENPFHYLPLVPNSKLPAMKDYPKKASRDPNRRIQWKNRGYGLGYSTSQFGDTEALVVIDIDMKDGKNGELEIKKLEMLGYEFPETYTQYTPTGGRHLIYKAPKAVKQGTDVLARGLDIRSKGGYVVASGTELSGKCYTDNAHPVVECPQWVIDKCGEAPEKLSVPEASVEIDLERAERRARDYLSTAPGAVAGESGNATTYKVACKLKDLGLAENHTYDLLSEMWNPNCRPPWSAHELAKKVHDAYTYGLRPVGAEAPEVMFQDAPVLSLVPTPVPVMAYDEYLAHMNKEHAFVTTGNGHRVIWEKRDGDDGITLEFLPEPTFRAMYQNNFMPTAGKGRQKTKAEAWLEWPGRRQYRGLGFYPGTTKPRNGYYNLWKGYSCEPVPYFKASPEAQHGFDLFIEHAKKNITSNEAEFKWLMGYFAHMFQKPNARPLTTVVFKGSKGTGKNSFVERIGNILGQNFIPANDSRYLTGQFNSHMEACLLLMLDEAFWSGDKGAEGKLKGLTTSPTFLVERKGMEPRTARNYMRIIVLGNEQWLVPASADERRYAVFNIGDGKKQNGTFFADLRKGIDEQGGNSVLLDYFQNFDLSTVDVNVAPKTKGLLEQKEESLDPLQEWWKDCLNEGMIESVGESSPWPGEIATHTLRDAFDRHAKLRNIRKWGLTGSQFGRKFREICPSLERKDKRVETGKVKVYCLPSLKVARADWDKFIGHETEWRDE